ncbi:MAG: PAS domain-containing protein, partial [Proteobacteria bacterium]|nr:PAS domain-containing protein [Pseudomonadota bacterium]
ESVLSSMREGVMAVDKDERILSLNRAAIDVFDLGSGDPLPRNLKETIRHPELHALVEETLSEGKSTEGDIGPSEKTNRVLNVRCSPIDNTQGERTGALVVLSDVTRLRKLENIRRDFVANVSHEIKTPLTAIKGFVETLLHGAVQENPEEAERFLTIIDKHVGRMHMLVEDLLSLARIEKLDEENETTFSEHKVDNIIYVALQIVQSKATVKNVAFSIDCPEDLSAEFDGTLLEQAVVNLLDNAVKYSPESSQVRIAA